MPSGRLWAVNASNATAASGIAWSGEPRTLNVPVDELEVVLGRLHLVGGDRARPCRSPCRTAMVDGDATDGQRARAVGVEPERAMAVSECSTSTSSGPTPSWSATIIDHAGLVALAVRRGAGDDLDLVRSAATRTVAASQPPARVVERRRAPATGRARTSRSRTRCRCRGAACRRRRGGAACSARRSS